MYVVDCRMDEAHLKYEASFPKGTLEVAPKQTYGDWDSNWDGESSLCANRKRRNSHKTALHKMMTYIY